MRQCASSSTLKHREKQLRYRNHLQYSLAFPTKLTGLRSKFGAARHPIRNQYSSTSFPRLASFSKFSSLLHIRYRRISPLAFFAIGEPDPAAGARWKCYLGLRKLRAVYGSELLLARVALNTSRPLHFGRASFSRQSPQLRLSKRVWCTAKTAGMTIRIFKRRLPHFLLCECFT